MIVRRLLSLLVPVALLAACGGSESLDTPGRGSFRKGPISIRGWFSTIHVGTAEPQVFAVTDPNERVTPYQRRLLEETNVSLEDVPYASGGVLDSGAFMILDSPPGRVVINMQAPGVPLVQLPLENIPPNADVFIPGIELYPERFEIRDPSKIIVRVPTSGAERRKSAEQAVVGGHPVEIWEVPLREMMDRRDWPVPN